LWQTWRQMEAALFEYINGFCNQLRMHSTLGGKSPLAFERMAA
jgi:putative transposase